MLKKIVSIKNIGTFLSCHAHKIAEMRRLTLIHGENGRGKTTLCAILRSLRNNNPDLIVGRKTLDSNDAPHVEAFFDTGSVAFKNNAWTSHCSNIEIFDEEFVSENVHLGDLITLDNKRNLCRVVLGAEGVELAKKFDECDALVRTRSSETNTAKEAIQKLLPNEISFDQFMGFLRDPDIDLKIAEKKGEIRISEDAAPIREKQTLVPLDLPKPYSITNTLLKTVEGISDETEKIVRQHIEDHKMGNRGESWLAEGLRYAAEKDCPFCAQSLEGSTALQIYKSFFSHAYRDFQQELTQLKGAVDQPLSDAVLLTVQKHLMDSAALIEFWRKYVPNIPRQPSFNDRIQPVILTLRNALSPLVLRKLESPLEKVTYSDEANLAIKEWMELKKEVDIYNGQITIFNSSILAVKASMSSKNIAELQRELAVLEAQKFRYEQSAKDAVIAYFNSLGIKSKADEEKNKAKQELNTYTTTIIEEYHESVNKLLARFGAAFSIAKIKVDYVGRTPRTAYTFMIRDKEIDPGNDKTQDGTACFRNTLSAGDRRTLALAFFIVRLEKRKDLGNLIVVFDDPFTSLDSFRQNWTCNKIRKLATEAKQVIVLSHSLHFLELLSERFDKMSLCTLQIDRQNQHDSCIAPLHLSDATAVSFQKDVIQLLNFHSGDEKDEYDTIRCIRPVLENHLRKMAPDNCPEGSGWLGTFLSDIHKANAGSPFLPMYDDLDKLNSYTSPYSHDLGRSLQINLAELRAAVKLTLTIIDRI